MKDFCHTFKPFGKFQGIKVYNKYIETDFENTNENYKHFMYRNGNEWEIQFEVNITTVKLTMLLATMKNMRADGSPVIHRFNYKTSEFDLYRAGFRIDTFNLNLDKSLSHVYLGENSSPTKLLPLDIRTKYEDTFSSDSILVFNPSKLKSDIPIVLNKTNPSLIQYYDPIEDRIFLNNSFLEFRKLSSFISQIPKELLQMLDGIMEVYPYDLFKRGWLLFFNNNSKPMMCYARESMFYHDEVSIFIFK